VKNHRAWPAAVDVAAPAVSRRHEAGIWTGCLAVRRSKFDASSRSSGYGQAPRAVGGRCRRCTSLEPRGEPQRCRCSCSPAEDVISSGPASVLVIRAQICELRCSDPALCYAQSSTRVHVKLFYQTHSPYARKVLVMAHEVGLAERMEVIHQETSPVVRNDAVFALNPLGKVPVLVTGDGDC